MPPPPYPPLLPPPLPPPPLALFPPASTSPTSNSLTIGLAVGLGVGLTLLLAFLVAYYFPSYWLARTLKREEARLRELEERQGQGQGQGQGGKKDLGEWYWADHGSAKSPNTPNATPLATPRGLAPCPIDPPLLLLPLLTLLLIKQSSWSMKRQRIVLQSKLAWQRSPLRTWPRDQTPHRGHSEGAERKHPLIMNGSLLKSCFGT